jgi:hypothetical protein
MAPHTTAVEKAIICTMKKLGSSNDAVCAALIDHHNLTNQQINCIFACYGDKENYDPVGHKTGHPHKLTPHNRHVVLHHLANGDVANATELQNEYFPEVSITRRGQACLYPSHSPIHLAEELTHLKEVG